MTSQKKASNQTLQLQHCTCDCQQGKTQTARKDQHIFNAQYRTQDVIILHKSIQRKRIDVWGNETLAKHAEGLFELNIEYSTTHYSAFRLVVKPDVNNKCIA